MQEFNAQRSGFEQRASQAGTSLDPSIGVGRWQYQEKLSRETKGVDGGGHQ